MKGQNEQTNDDMSLDIKILIRGIIIVILFPTLIDKSPEPSNEQIRILFYTKNI